MNDATNALGGIAIFEDVLSVPDGEPVEDPLATLSDDDREQLRDELREVVQKQRAAEELTNTLRVR